MILWCLAVLSVALFSDVKSSGVAPTIVLNNGKLMPSLGLGTWLGFTKTGNREEAKGEEVQKAVEWAIDAGYRHIDTAFIYNTEQQVGKAIRNKIAEGVIERKHLFLTTKLWNDKHAKEDVIPALRLSLEKLGLDYVDLYLIHWPVALNADSSLSETDYLDTWEGMMQVLTLGLARSIGVSNFNQEQLVRLIDTSSIAPQVLQVEINLNLQQPSLLEYCRSQNITVTGYTPFGSLFYNKAAEDAPQPRIDTPALVEIANKYNKTVPQVALRYLVELGVIPIPKSVTKSRVEQNIAVFDFHLSDDEKKLLKSYDQSYRTIPVKHWAKSKYYPF